MTAVTIKTRSTAAERKAARPANAGPAAPTRILKRLFVVRESSAYKWRLFEAMMFQVLQAYADLPSVQTILGHGVKLIRPGSVGDDLRAGLRAIPVRAASEGKRIGKIVAYLIVIGEDGFLLSQMSASRMNADGTQDFGLLLSGLISDYRPEELITGPVTRFGRSAQVFAQAKGALSAAGTLVRSDEAREGLDVREPDDSLRWDLFGLIAAQEVREILKRLTIGRLVDAQAGCWPLGERGLVLGYELHNKKPRVSSNPVVLGWVRTLIELGADPEVSDEEIAERMADLGLTTGKLQALYGPRARDGEGKGDESIDPGADAELPQGTLLDAKRPVEVIRRLYGHLETYLSGHYRFDLTCPLPGVKEWCGVPVRRDDEGDASGRFEIEIPMGHAEGFERASREVIEKAIALRCGAASPRLTGGAGHNDKIKPFTGLPGGTGDDGIRWKLTGKTSNYHVVPDAVTGTATSAAVVATMNPVELHQSFAAQVTSTLAEKGFDPTRTSFASTSAARAVRGPLPDVEEVALRTEQETLTAENRGLVKLEARAEDEQDEGAAAEYRDARAENKRRLRQIEQLLKESQDARAAAAGPATRVDVATLPELVALLAGDAAQHAKVVQTTLRRLITGWRVTPRAYQVEWSCELRLPSDQGIAYVPVRGAVRNIAKGGPDSHGPVGALRKQWLVDQWATGMTVADMAALRGHKVDTVSRQLRSALAATLTGVAPRMLFALTDSPIIEVRQSVLRWAGSCPAGSPWEQLIRDTYGDGELAWGEAWAADTHATRYAVLDALIADGVCRDAGLPVDELSRIAKVSVKTLEEAFCGKVYDRGGRIKGPRYGAIVERDDWSAITAAEDKRIRLRTCPWCRTPSVTVVCRAPELGAWPALCASCLRRPDDPLGIRFPTSYGARWSGPRSGSWGAGQGGTRSVD